MVNLVLLRHGESVWNKANRFTGWTDVDLSEKGFEEAAKAGMVLKDKGFKFDIAFTSVLKRAIETLDIVLSEMDLKAIPVEKSWLLNERHYGALQGLNKAETAAKYGDEQVAIWRRSYSIRPPALTRDDNRFPGNDPLYKNIDVKYLPLTESLEDTVNRFLPYWLNSIEPHVHKNENVIIVAHGNTLRALVKHIDGISEDNIATLDIPTGIPLLYKYTSSYKPLGHPTFDALI